MTAIPQLKPLTIKVARLTAPEFLQHDTPERFECHGCGKELTAEGYEVFGELCRSCECEQQEENAADARRDDRD